MSSVELYCFIYTDILFGYIAEPINGVSPTTELMKFIKVVFIGRLFG